MGFNHLKHLIACHQGIEGIDNKLAIPQLMVPIMNVASAGNDLVSKGKQKATATHLFSSGEFKVECPTTEGPRANLYQNYSDFKRTLMAGSSVDQPPPMGGEAFLFHVENSDDRGLRFNAINEKGGHDVLERIEPRTGGTLTNDDRKDIKSICCSDSFSPLLPYFDKFFTLFSATPVSLFLSMVNAAGSLMKPSYYLIKSGNGFHIAFYSSPLTIKHYQPRADGMSEYVFRFMTPNILDPEYYQGTPEEMVVRYFISEIGDFPSVKEFAQAELTDIFGELGPAAGGGEQGGASPIFTPRSDPGRMSGAAGGAAGGGAAGDPPSFLDNLMEAKRESANFYGDDNLTVMTADDKITCLTTQALGYIGETITSGTYIKCSSIDTAGKSREVIISSIGVEDVMKLKTSKNCVLVDESSGDVMGKLLDVGFSDGCRVLVNYKGDMGKKKRGLHRGTQTNKVYLVSPKRYSREARELAFVFFDSGNIGNIGNLNVWGAYGNLLQVQDTPDEEINDVPGNMMASNLGEMHLTVYPKSNKTNTSLSFEYIPHEQENLEGYTLESDDPYIAILKINGVSIGCIFSFKDKAERVLVLVKRPNKMPGKSDRGIVYFLDNTPEMEPVGDDRKRYTYTLIKPSINFDTSKNGVYTRYYLKCLELVESGGLSTEEYKKREDKKLQLGQAYDVKYMIENDHTYRECIMTLQSGRVGGDLTREGKLKGRAGETGIHYKLWSKLNKLMGKNEPFFTADEIKDFEEIKESMNEGDLVTANRELDKQFVLTEEDLGGVARDSEKTPVPFGGVLVMEDFLALQREGRGRGAEQQGHPPAPTPSPAPVPTSPPAPAPTTLEGAETEAAVASQQELVARAGTLAAEMEEMKAAVSRIEGMTEKGA
jgi:hypothetical protein